MIETVVEKSPASSDTTSAQPLKVVVPIAVASQKKKNSSQVLFAVLAVIILSIGALVSLILVRNNNDTRQQAAGPAYDVCQGLTEACDNTTNPCCAGYVCQGTNNARRCEDPGTTNICGDDATCGGPGGWIAFRCDQLRLYDDSPVPQCRENPVTRDTYEEAVEYTGGCGQVDEVCVGGGKNRELCGSFQILDGECRQPSPPPSTVPSPTPQPSPTPGVTPSPNPSPSPPAPICVAISANTQTFTVGTQVTFTCGTVTTATRYEFRVRRPDQTVQTLTASATGSTTSLPFSITSTGQYAAQCRICTGAAPTCQEWEPLP